MWRELAPARVVDQNVQSAPSLLDIADHASDLCIARDIRGVSPSLAPGLRDVCRDFVGGRRRGPVIDQDTCALGCQRLANATPHSCTATSYDCDLTLKFHAWIPGG